MDVDELVDNREKDIHEVDGIFLGGWESAVVVLEQPEQTVTEEQTETYRCNRNTLKIIHERTTELYLK